MRVGHGLDVHALVAGRPLVLGGVAVPHDRGLAGHSDGDALLHAVASALLGALGEGDLGRHFPSSDPALRDVASTEILRRVAAMVRGASLEVAHLDTTVVAQQPRLAAWLPKMEAVIADALGVPGERVNVKVTSTDGLGAIGRGEGIGAQAVVLLVAAGSAGAA